MSFYHDLILDHYRNPRHYGDLPDADIAVKEENIGCGDDVEVQLQVTNDKRQVREIMWKGRGCAIMMAAASLLSEHICQVRQIRQIRQISEHDMIALLGGDISPSRMKCATLALKALQQALAKFSESRVQGSVITF